VAYDEQLAARVRHAIGARPDVTERKMFGGLSFLRDGRMCCGIIGQDLIVRVLEAEMAAVMQQRHVRPMDFTGRPLRGFVYVAPTGCSTPAALKAWIGRGLRFAASPETLTKTRTAGKRRIKR
jgi:TfoX/Sxy family transcriptional regulator of competence genes